MIPAVPLQQGTDPQRDLRRIRTTFHEGPSKTIADIEYATAGWVDWYNNRRLHGSLGMMTPGEYGNTHCATLKREPQPA